MFDTVNNSFFGSYFVGHGFSNAPVIIVVDHNNTGLVEIKIC